MKAPKPLPALQYLHQCFEVRPCGTLVWKARPAAHFRAPWTAAYVNGRLAGTNAGKARSDGYRSVKVSGRNFAEHRIVYALHYGVDPGSMTVDHIDGERTNNAPVNLRLALEAQNNCSRHGPSANNKHSGYRGVTRSGNRWQARLRKDGKHIHVGTFATKEEAQEAVSEARRLHFGDFAGSDGAA